MVARELGGGGALSGNGGGAVLAFAWLGRGDEKRTGSANEAAGAGRRGGHDGLTYRDDAGVWLPPGVSSQRLVGHDG